MISAYLSSWLPLFWSSYVGCVSPSKKSHSVYTVYMCTHVCLKLWSSSLTLGLSGGSDGKEYACTAADPGSVPGLERSPGEGKGNPLQYSCLENSMDRGAWSDHKELDMTEQLTVSLSFRYKNYIGLHC